MKKRKEWTSVCQHGPQENKNSYCSDGCNVFQLKIFRHLTCKIWLSFSLLNVFEDISYFPNININIPNIKSHTAKKNIVQKYSTVIFIAITVIFAN